MILRDSAVERNYLLFRCGATLQNCLLNEAVNDQNIGVGWLAFLELNKWQQIDYEGWYLFPTEVGGVRIIDHKVVQSNHLKRLTELDWREGWSAVGYPPTLHLTYTPPHAVVPIPEWLVKSWL